MDDQKHIGPDSLRRRERQVRPSLHADLVTRHHPLQQSEVGFIIRDEGLFLRITGEAVTASRYSKAAQNSDVALPFVGSDSPRSTRNWSYSSKNE